MNIQQARHNMIYQQIRTLGVDESILAVLTNTPREFFVPTNYSKLAFAEIPIPLEHGQVMMLPAEEARMLQALNLRPTDKVLEVGTGSGYMTAALAKLSGHVDSVDIFPEFVEQARDKLTQLNINNVTLHCGDIFSDTRIKGIYDAIAITGALPILPNNFRRLLTPNSRMFAILGSPPAMTACLITLTDKRDWHINTLFETVLSSLLHAPQSAVLML
ncbi:protein-L-isoaspartate O-methyltransferase [soil metagenome]